MDTLSETAYAILRDAVKVTREYQVQSLNALKSRLILRWPGKEAEIADAINFWANNVRESHPRGVPCI